MSSPCWFETVRSLALFSEHWPFCSPFPIVWDNERKQLRWISSKHYAAPFLVTTAITLFAIGCGLLCLLDEQFFKQGLPMSRFKLSMCGLICSVLLTGVALSILLQIYGQCYVHNFNLEKNLESFLREVVDCPTFGINTNVYGQTLNLLIRFVAYEPYIMISSIFVLNLLINFDPVACLLVKYDMVASIGWKAWLLLYCLRNLAILIAASDCARNFVGWVYIIPQFLIMKNNFNLMEKYEETLGFPDNVDIEEEHSAEMPSPIVIYTRRYLGLVATEIMLKCGLLTLAGYVFVADCTLIYIFIKEFHVIGLLMKIFTVFCIILVNAVLGIVIPACIALHEESEKILRQWKYHEGRTKKCFRKRVAALRLMTLHGGVGSHNFFALVPSFKAQFYYAILDYVITMLLSF